MSFKKKIKHSLNDKKIIKNKIDIFVNNIKKTILKNYKNFKENNYNIFFEFCNINDNYSINDNDENNFYIKYIDFEKEKEINNLLLDIFNDKNDKSLRINFDIINNYNDKWTLFTCDNYIKLINKIFNLRYDITINIYDNIKGSLIDHYIKYLTNQLKLIIGRTPRFIESRSYIPENIIKIFVDNGIMRTVITNIPFGYYGDLFLKKANENNNCTFNKKFKY